MKNPATPDPQSVPVTLLTSTHEALTELAVLRHAVRVAIDTETEVQRDEDGKILKVDLDVPQSIGGWRVMSIAARFLVNGEVVDRAWVVDMLTVNPFELAPLFTGLRPWGWNANFDRAVLKRGGIFIRTWWDGMVCDAVQRQGAYFGAGDRVWYFGLEAAAQRHLGMVDIEGKTDTRYSYDMVTPLTEEQIRYAADDAVTTLWLADPLMDLLEKHGLVEVADRSCRAQNFIHGFARNGLPLDREGYTGEIDQVKLQAAQAAERLAVATTGRELLSTIVRWAVSAGRLSSEPEDVVEVGLELLKEPGLMVQFIEAVRAQLESCKQRMSQLVGTGEQVDDLFSDNVSWVIPFDPDNGTSIRRWLTKNTPVFVAEYLASVGATSRGLTAANDLEQVYVAMMASQGTDVTDELKELALLLASYARYARIREAYGSTSLVEEVWLKPDWNINSADQVRAMLNQFSQDEVLAYTAAKDGAPRLLGKADSVDATALKLIGGQVAGALLAYRKHEKIVSTYGDKLMEYINPLTGRVHAKYTQELTGTGRLASDKPNAQNLSPLAKPHIGLTKKGSDGQLVTRDEQGRTRVLVCADLSQAELRFLSDMAGDENMLGAFRRGEDLHVRTATLMFGVELLFLLDNGDKEIRELVSLTPGLDQYVAADPSMKAKVLYKTLRSKAKAVGFGYAYGLKGQSLATQLTVQGVPTTKEEADELLRAFDRAYPQVAAWMQVRVDFIQNLSEGMKNGTLAGDVDFEASWRLHRLYSKAAQVKKALKAKLGRTPSDVEIAEVLVPIAELTEKITAGGQEATDEVVAQWRGQQAAQIAWALGHYGSAVLTKDGTPWTFESRNVTGRRRLFQVGTADWVWAMVELVARSRRAYAQGVRDEFVRQYNAQLLEDHQALVAAGKPQREPKLLSLTKVDPRTKREIALSREELEKALPKELRTAFISFVLAQYDKLGNPAAARDTLFRHAMGDQIRAKGNQYRNHPIQSGVADAVLEAYARIDAELLERFPNALGIQSVHDSIVVECDLKDAIAVREIVVRHMEACLSELCPNVPAKADGDVQLSLDDKSTITDAEIEAFLEAETRKLAVLAA